MFLADPAPSPFDLNFRLFGTHVRVHPFFWLGSALLGWPLADSAHPVTGNGLGDLALWILCSFVSILLHEFGHVIAFRLFGNDAHVVLHGFGGLAIPDGESRHRWQRILVSAAGPGIQLLLWAGLMAFVWSGQVASLTPPLKFVFAQLLFINLIWPLFNLLPIWPLDGGQITREVCEGVSRSRGAIVALWISLLLSATLAIHALLAANGNRLIPFAPSGMFAAIFFALLAVGSYQVLQAEQARHRGWKEDWPWDR